MNILINMKILKKYIYIIFKYNIYIIIEIFLNRKIIKYYNQKFNSHFTIKYFDRILFILFITNYIIIQ